MINMNTDDLIEVYEKAIELNLVRDFIEILELELLSRGVTNLSKTLVTT